MEHEDMKVGAAIHRLDHILGRYISGNVKNLGYDDVSVMHGWVIRYLYDHRDTDVFQKDIERKFSIGRSAVTSILQLMEKKGYVRRMNVEQDARLKKVELTQAGIECHEKMEILAAEMDRAMLREIDREDLETFLAVSEKIEENIKNDVKNDRAAEGAGDCNIREEGCHASDFVESGQGI